MYNVQKSGREALVHMPKKIAELREKMIAYARQALLQEGTSALTVRSTASACGVAVGTVYNPPTRLNANEAFYRRHGVFVEQLCGLIQPVILRCDCLYHPVLPEFLAEALLVLAADPEKHFENVRPIFARLL